LGTLWFTARFWSTNELTEEMPLNRQLQEEWIFLPACLSLRSYMGGRGDSGRFLQLHERRNPLETANQIGNPQLSDVKRELQNATKHWIEKTPANGRDEYIRSQLRKST